MFVGDIRNDELKKWPVPGVWSSRPAQVEWGSVGKLTSIGYHWVILTNWTQVVCCCQKIELVPRCGFPLLRGEALVLSESFKTVTGRDVFANITLQSLRGICKEAYLTFSRHLKTIDLGLHFQQYVAQAQSSPWRRWRLGNATLRTTSWRSSSEEMHGGGRRPQKWWRRGKAMMLPYSTNLTSSIVVTVGFGRYRSS